MLIYRSLSFYGLLLYGCTDETRHVCMYDLTSNSETHHQHDASRVLAWRPLTHGSSIDGLTCTGPNVESRPRGAR